nr:hypothetical protein [uncultured Porphyromonas sp.]
MYHDTFGSAVGCMGCVPRLALLVTLCLPLGCGAPRVTTEGTHTRRSDSLLSRHAAHTTMQTQSETEEEFLGLYPLPHPTTLQGDSSAPTKLLPLLYYHRRTTRQEGMQSSLRDDSVTRKYETSTHTQLKTLRRGSAVGFFARVKTFLWGILFTALTLAGLVGYSYWRRRR